MWDSHPGRTPSRTSPPLPGRGTCYWTVWRRCELLWHQGCTSAPPVIKKNQSWWYMQTHSILTIFHYFIKMLFIFITLKYDNLGTIFKEIHTLKASFIELISFSSLTQNLVTPIAWIAYNSSSRERTGLGFSSEEYRSSITLLAGSGRYRSFTLGAVIFLQ